jgi:hypothetical protein
MEARERAEAHARQSAAQAEALRRQSEADRAEAARVKAEYEAVRKDPWSMLNASGLTPEQVVARSQEEADPIKRLEKQNRELSEKFEASERARRESEERSAAERRQRESQAAVEASERDFVALGKNEKKYPIVSKFAKDDPETLIARAQSLVNKIHAKAQRDGVAPPSIPDQELLAYLENHWTKSGLFASGTSSGSPSGGNPVIQATIGNAAAGSDSPGTGSATLSNADSAQAISVANGGKKLSRREEIAQAAEAYRATREANRRTKA